ncbi:MAG: hypothetical protein AAF514_21770 [Verrucomicrobiota bacterium]
MLSLAKENSPPRLGKNTVPLHRYFLGAFWLLDGLILKILQPSEDMIASFGPTAALMGQEPAHVCEWFGYLEIILAVLLFTGLWHLVAAVLQVLFLVFLIWVEGLTSFIWRLPIIPSILLLAIYGPGAYCATLGKRRVRQTWTRG